MRPIREQAARLGRKNRTRTVPRAEPLDDRIVPAVVGAGHGGFVVEAAAQHQNAYILRLQEMRQQLQARREARIEQVLAFRQERLARINAVSRLDAARFGPGNLAGHPYLQALRARRMVSSGVSTPRGPLALASNSLGPNSTSPYHPTSPNDFPFGPGGFYSVHTTPGGELVGLSSVSGPTAVGPSGSGAPAARLTTAPSPSTSLTSENTPAGVSTDTTTGPNSTTMPYHPTSPNDFPFGPGGFFSVTTAPDGSFVGLI